MFRIFAALLLSLSSVFAELTTIDQYTLYTSNPDSGAVGIPYDGGVIPIDSAGTYYLRAKIESPITSDSRIFLAPSPYAVTLYLNGHKIYQWGIGDSTPCLANYSAESILIPAEFLNDSGSTITAEFFSDGARIAFPRVAVGTVQEVEEERFTVSMLNFVLIRVIVGIGAFAAVFLLVYFALSGFKDFRVLFLSLFCLSLVAGYNMFVLNGYFFDQVILFKTARVGGAMMSLTMFLFITSLTGILSGLTYRVVVSAAFIPYLVMIIQAGSKFQINTIFNAATNTLIFPLLLVGLVLLIFSAVKNRKIETFTVLVPYVFLMSAVFSDMGTMILFRQPDFWKIPYGYLIMIAGGIFSVLFSRTSDAHSLQSTNQQLVSQLNSVMQKSTENARMSRIFLQQLSHISRHTEDSFVHLLNTEMAKNLQNEVREIYARSVLSSVHSNNLLYLEKISNHELCLWYDGFSIQKMLEEKQAVFESFAEERGVELHMTSYFPSFPALVWGDEQAIFQIIANTIIAAVDTEQGTLRVHLRYISYEGLEVMIQGSIPGFSGRLLSVIDSGVWHDQVNPVALVLKELLIRHDTFFEFAETDTHQGAIRTILPLKLSEIQS